MVSRIWASSSSCVITPEKKLTAVNLQHALSLVFRTLIPGHSLMLTSMCHLFHHFPHFLLCLSFSLSSTLAIICLFSSVSAFYILSVFFTSFHIRHVCLFSSSFIIKHHFSLFSAFSTLPIMTVFFSAFSTLDIMSVFFHHLSH